MSSTDVLDIPADLRFWARGTYATEAATAVLIRASNSRVARRGYPWIVIDNGRAWLDVDQISDDNIDAYSGAERRVLALVAALATTREIDLGDIASGVGRENLGLILAAIAHAGGSHEHSGMKLDGDGRPVGFIKLTTLDAWPVVGVEPRVAVRQNNDHNPVVLTYRRRAIGKRVHSGPKSSRHGGRHSTIVTCRSATSASTRTSSRNCSGERARHHRCTRATSVSGKPAIRHAPAPDPE